MSNYRGLLWSLVAIAGTATAATLAYRYVTRSVRPSESDSEEDDAIGAARDGAARRTRTAANEHQSATTEADGEGEDVEWLSESEAGDSVEELDDSVQTQSQQMALVAREGNLVRLVECEGPSGWFT